MKKKTLYLLVLCVALLVPAVQAAVLTPDADTYMRDTTPRGGEGHMDIHGSAGRAGYTRFDLSALIGQTITDASLTYTATLGGARQDTIVSGRVGLKGLDTVAGNTPQNWDEATLSTADVGLEHPGSADYDPLLVTELDAENGANVTETIVAAGAGAWEPGTTVTITGADLIAFLQNAIDNEAGLATFIMSFPGTDGRGYALATNENTLGHAAATLTIIPEPATMILLGLGGLALRRRR